MLVIRRRAGESFRIGDNVEIEILEAGGGQVKIGIRAPRDIPVLRTEMYLTSKQNVTAAESALELTEALVREFNPRPLKSPSNSQRPPR